MVWHTWSVVGRPESSIVTQSYYWPFNWPKGALAFDNGDDDELDIAPQSKKRKQEKIQNTRYEMKMKTHLGNEW